MSQMSSPLSMSRRLHGHQRKIIHETISSLSGYTLDGGTIPVTSPSLFRNEKLTTFTVHDTRLPPTERKESPVVVGHRYRYRLSLHSAFLRHNDPPPSMEQTAATTQSLFIDVRHHLVKGQAYKRLLVRICRRRIHTNLSLGVIGQNMTSRSRAGKNEQLIRAEHGELSAQKMIKNK
ncbi:hypothetical protein BLNAU_23749 [Blattamonas nauphoetae]|uniref:Uncharacterized protein n=1 Tax=Blattamonas nauphoetae TaxID=2049346 RepID=A0ABQ9WPV1_9EUKA|nr:hypothetical protein BLNAU_24685 [Blattamonas nauphoetae]KAK2941343.1 hypothetical protein BLNAU_23749 [Blattamonas nauphoetae]